MSRFGSLLNVTLIIPHLEFKTTYRRYAVSRNTFKNMHS